MVMGKPNYSEINLFRCLSVGDWTEIYWSYAIVCHVG